MATIGGPVIPGVTEGLVLYLDAANEDSYPGTGTVWRDLSKSNYSGSLVNGPVHSGRSKSANFLFDGTNDLIDFTDGPLLNSAVTADVWIKILGNSGGSGSAGTIIYHGGRYLQYINTGRIASYWNGGYYYTPIGSISFNNWVHISQVWDSPNGTLKVYINSDLLLTQGISTGTKSASNNLQIGMEGTNPSGPYARIFNGQIAIVKLYNRALTAAEVLQNYNATKSRFNL